MKKLTLFVITLLIAASALAQEHPSVYIYIDGKPQSTKYPPVLINGRTLLALRETFNALGAEVQWFGEEKKIVARKGETEIELWIGKQTALVNGEEVKLDQSPVLFHYAKHGEATLVPLRFVSEALGADVLYDHERNRVDINMSD